MSNWPVPYFARFDVEGLSTGTATSVTPNATTTLKGSYATIGSATPFVYRGFFLTVMMSGSGSGQGHRIDVACNTTSDQIIVQDLLVDMFAGANNASSSTWFPIQIPAGATIKARTMSPGGSSSVIKIGVVGCAGGVGMPQAFRAALKGTDFNATTPTWPANSVTPSGTTQTGWATVISSTPARFCGLYVSPTCGASISRSSTDVTFDIGVGSAGNEKVLFSVQTKWNTVSITGRNVFGPYPVDIPAGSRIAFRIQNAATSNTATFCSCLGLAA